jgi:DNA-binding MarR family transcriptional regulator
MASPAADIAPAAPDSTAGRSPAAAPDSTAGRSPTAPDSTAGRSPAAAEFSSAWEAFFRATRRARGRAAGQVAGGGLSLSQYHLLEGLRERRTMTMSELALAAGVAPPTATRMLDGLVRDGRVVRRASDKDRRAVLVSLTDEGRAAVKAAARRVEQARARVSDQLTPAEQEQAVRLLHRLAEVVDAQL